MAGSAGAEGQRVSLGQQTTPTCSSALLLGLSAHRKTVCFCLFASLHTLQQQSELSYAYAAFHARSSYAYAAFFGLSS